MSSSKRAEEGGAAGAGGGKAVAKEGKKAVVKKKRKKKRRGVVVINMEHCKYEVVEDCALARGWRVTGEEDTVPWNVYWIDTSVSPERCMAMKNYQKINHFPGMNMLSRKNGLARALGRMKQAFPAEYQFAPQAWTIPEQWHDFRAQFDGKPKNRTYIVKPDHGCQGKGIFLTRSCDNVDPGEPQVAQRYVQRPLLIEGLKFDLRVYVLVTSCAPLRMFMFKDGLTRLCTEKYQVPNNKNLKKLTMHLTNYAINKVSDKFVFNEGTSEEALGVGSKRTLLWFKKWLAENGHDADLAWARMYDMIVKTLIPVQPGLAHMYRSCLPADNEGFSCFEILGLDILFDHKLRPWLIEVNHSPSFSCDTPLDLKIKEELIADTMELIGVAPSDRRKHLAQQAAEAQSRLYSGVFDPAARREQFEESREKMMAKRKKWEDKHIGGFTRIYPVEDEEVMGKYATFTAYAEERFEEKSLSQTRRTVVKRVASSFAAVIASKRKGTKKPRDRSAIDAKEEAGETDSPISRRAERLRRTNTIETTATSGTLPATHGALARERMSPPPPSVTPSRDVRAAVHHASEVRGSPLELVEGSAMPVPKPPGSASLSSRSPSKTVMRRPQSRGSDVSGRSTNRGAGTDAPAAAAGYQTVQQYLTSVSTSKELSAAEAVIVASRGPAKPSHSPKSARRPTSPRVVSARAKVNKLSPGQRSASSLSLMPAADEERRRQAADGATVRPNSAQAISVAVPSSTSDGQAVVSARDSASGSKRSSPKQHRSFATWVQEQGGTVPARAAVPKAAGEDKAGEADRAVSTMSRRPSVGVRRDFPASAMRPVADKPKKAPARSTGADGTRGPALLKLSSGRRPSGGGGALTAAGRRHKSGVSTTPIVSSSSSPSSHDQARTLYVSEGGVPKPKRSPKSASVKGSPPAPARAPPPPHDGGVEIEPYQQYLTYLRSVQSPVAQSHADALEHQLKLSAAVSRKLADTRAVNQKAASRPSASGSVARRSAPRKSRDSIGVLTGGMLRPSNLDGAGSRVMDPRGVTM